MFLPVRSNSNVLLARNEIARLEDDVAKNVTLKATLARRVEEILASARTLVADLPSIVLSAQLRLCLQLEHQVHVLEAEKLELEEMCGLQEGAMRQRDLLQMRLEQQLEIRDGVRAECANLL